MLTFSSEIEHRKEGGRGPRLVRDAHNNLVNDLTANMSTTPLKADIDLRDNVPKQLAT